MIGAEIAEDIISHIFADEGCQQIPSLAGFRIWLRNLKAWDPLENVG
jgi:hypothetical protein